MPDLEKVIKGLQIERECVSRDCDRDCGKCDLVQDRDWLLSVYDDAIALLKEQDAVRPVLDEQTGRIWLCGNCGSYVGFEDNDPNDPNEFDKYCRECGHPVSWKGLVKWE